MSTGQASGFKRFILWDYPRASWQYDVMVALILAFIFLTPREVFRARALIFALAWQEGRLLVGTGPEGQLFEVRDLGGEGSFNQRVEAWYAAQGGELSRERLLETARERFGLPKLRRAHPKCTGSDLSFRDLH